MLRISEPLKCDGNVLEIGVKSKFYFDRLTSALNQPIVEKVISEVLKAEVKIRPIIRENVVPIPMEIEGSDFVDNSSQSSYGESKVSLNKPVDVAQDVISMF